MSMNNPSPRFPTLLQRIFSVILYPSIGFARLNLLISDETIPRIVIAGLQLPIFHFILATWVHWGLHSEILASYSLSAGTIFWIITVVLLLNTLATYYLLVASIFTKIPSVYSQGKGNGSSNSKRRMGARTHVTPHPTPPHLMTQRIFSVILYPSIGFARLNVLIIEESFPRIGIALIQLPIFYYILAMWIHWSLNSGLLAQYSLSKSMIFWVIFMVLLLNNLATFYLLVASIFTKIPSVYSQEKRNGLFK